MVRKSEQRAASQWAVPFTNCMYAHKKQLGEFDVQKWRRGQGASGQILNGTHSDDDVSRANGLLFKSIFCQAEELFGSFFSQSQAMEEQGHAEKCHLRERADELDLLPPMQSSVGFKPMETLSRGLVLPPSRAPSFFLKGKCRN